MRDGTRRRAVMWLLLGALLPAAALGQTAAGKVGQRVMDERVEFTVRRAEWHPALRAAALAATPKGEFLALLVRAENGANVGSRRVGPDTVALRDARGRTFEHSAEAERVMAALHPGDAILFDKGKEIYPSLRVDGWVVFDVPKDATGLRLLVKGVPSSPGSLIELPPR